MNKFETILWWFGILVNVAAMTLFLWASCVGDWKVGFRALAPLVFIIVLVQSRKTIISSREAMAECDRMLRKIGKNNTK